MSAPDTSILVQVPMTRAISGSASRATASS
jgi:hypothetical protein